MKKLSALYLNVKFTVFLTVLVILSSIFLYSCKKTDLPLDHRGIDQIEIANKFFKVPAGTDPQIKRIINEIAKRNKSKEFVSSFALKNGYPVWNKVLAVKQGNINQNNVVGNIALDTIIYIPLVLQDGTQVNGFLRANMNDSIAIDYSLAQDYKSYPKSETSNAMTSDDFTLLVMKLDNITFGHEQFIIKDSSLFNNSRDNRLGNTNVTKTVKFKDSVSSFASNGYVNNNLTIAYYCEDIVISVCPTVSAFLKQDNTSWTTGTGGCEGGYSDIIEVCWEIITFSSGGGQLPGDGGGTPTGGGGGSGSNNIPHNYPCPETPPSINTPLCPAPGGGIGWVPIDDAPMDRICLNSFNFIQGNDNSYWETNMTYLKFESSNSVNTFSAYYFLPNDISDYAMNTEIYPSPFGPNIPPKSAFIYLSEFFPDLFQSDIQRIWDNSINSYVWRFSKYAAQKIASRCSNVAALIVSSQYGPSCSMQDHSPSQIDFRSKTESFLRCFFPTTSTKCRLSPSISSNTSVSTYSPTCN